MNKREMSEDRHRWWDTLLKSIAPFLTISGIFVGIWQYNREQDNIRERETAALSRNDALEFKRRIWEQQSKTYTEISTSVGIIISHIDDQKIFKAESTKFDSIYWGKALLSQDNNVREIIIKFHIDIKDVQRRPQDRDAKQRLMNRADELSKVMRESLHSSWQKLNIGD